MEARFEARKRELLNECKVHPEIFEEVQTRLKEFMEPFIETFVRTEQRGHAETYVSGLLSNLEHKNAESIAYRFGQDRLGLQHFLGGAEWDDAPLRLELARQVTGNDEMGRVFWFRSRLHSLGEQYLLAVPSNTLIRDREAEPPAYSGHGRRPKTPWQRADKWRAGLPEEAWTEIDVRDGSKGPLRVELVKRQVFARTPKRQEGHAEVLVVIRYRDRDDDRVVKVDYYLSDAKSETPLAEFGRVAKAEHRIEECLQRAKSKAGLADYQVRSWEAWHHHQTLGLLASWFLVTETRRGKKMDAVDHSAAGPRRDCLEPSQRVSVWSSRPHLKRTRALDKTKRTGTLVSLEAA